MAQELSLKHIIPVGLSSAFFTFAVTLAPINKMFLSNDPAIGGAAYSSFWNSLLSRPTFIPIAAPVFGSIISGIMAARSLSGTQAAHWYYAGVLSSIGHLLATHWGRPHLGKIVGRKQVFAQQDVDVKALTMQNRHDGSQFHTVHLVRTFTVDMAAMVFFYIGCMKVMA